MRSSRCLRTPARTLVVGVVAAVAAYGLPVAANAADAATASAPAVAGPAGRVASVPPAGSVQDLTGSPSGLPASTNASVSSGRHVGLLPKPAAAAAAVPAASGFVAGSSVPVAGQTTASSMVYDNPDGTRTAVTSPGPVRWKDAAGAWHDIDLTLAAQGDGTLAARSADPVSGIRLGSRSRAGVVSLPTPAGVIVAAHPDAVDVPATLAGHAATFGGAVGGGDLSVQLLSTGAEETLSLPTRAAALALPGAGYTTSFTLPAGVSARAGGAGVEFVDASGTVVAGFGGGIAHDASTANLGLGAQTSVTTRLVSQTGQVAVVASGVDPAWLTDTARVFPVAIDPSYYTNTSSSAGSGSSDSWVETNVTSSQYSSGELRVGYGFNQLNNTGGGDVARTLVKFGLGSAPNPHDEVTEAHLSINNYSSSACNATGIYLNGLAGGFSTSTVWTNAPGPDSAGQVSVTSIPGIGASGCAGNHWSAMDLTSLAQRWFHSGAANYGLRLQTTENSGAGWKKFYSGENGSGYAPALYVTYHYDLPAKPATVYTQFNDTLAPHLRATLVDPVGGTALTGVWTVTDTTDGSHFTLSPATSYPSGGADAEADIATGQVKVGHRYTWTVHACSSYGCGPESDPYPVLNPALDGGSAGYQFDTHTLTDRSQLKVNLATGNLLITATDLTLPGVGHDLSYGRSYNSSNGDNGSFGVNWFGTTYPDVHLSINGDKSEVSFNDTTGGVRGFTDPGHTNTYQPPPGMDATLTRDPNANTYTMKMHSSGETLTFDASGLLTADKDRNGNTPTWSPNPYSAGTVTGDRASSPSNQLSTAYNAAGQISNINQDDGNGQQRAVFYGYDQYGRFGQVTEANGRLTSYSLGAYNQVTQVIVSDSTSTSTRETDIGYDSQGRVTSVTQDPAGINAVTSYDYTSQGGHTHLYDANHANPGDGTGVFTNYGYDYAGRITSTKDPLGHSRSASYTPDNQLSATTDAAGNGSSMTYTAANDPAGNQNGPENMTSMTDQAGSTSTADYTGASTTAPGGAYQPGWTSGPDGNKTSYTYDGPGNTESSGNRSGTPSAATATVKHNPDGTANYSIDPNNNAKTINGLTRCGSTSSSDPASNCTSYGYTNHSLTSITPVQQTRPAGEQLGVRSYSYDSFGRLATATSGKGVTTSYSYDKLDRTSATSYSDGTPTISYTYDTAGKTLTRSQGQTQSTGYQYDALGRLTGKNTAGSAVTCPNAASNSMLCYTYDKKGQLTSSSDGRGTDSYTYDAAGRTITLAEATGRVDVFGYNTNDKRTDTWQAATGQGAPDNLGQVSAPTGSAGHTVTTLDKAGKPTEIKTTTGSANTAAVDLTYAYTPQSGAPTCQNSYTGLNTRKIMQAQDTVAGSTTTYCYDGAGRLTEANTTGGPAPSDYTYTYDADGNITAGTPGTHAYDPANQLTDTGAAYDPAGNQTAGTAPDSSTLGAGYNGIDQTTSITTGAGSTPFAYAGTGQNERTSAGTSSYANGQPGLQSQTTGTTVTYFIRDPKGTLVSMATANIATPALAGSSPAGYYLQGTTGSVVGLIDSSGVRNATYTYDPYGHRRPGGDADPARQDRAHRSPEGVLLEV